MAIDEERYSAGYGHGHRRIHNSVCSDTRGVAEPLRRKNNKPEGMGTRSTHHLEGVGEVEVGWSSVMIVESRRSIRWNSHQGWCGFLHAGPKRALILTAFGDTLYGIT